MKPTIVLVGRPNVGKSTLFNRLTKSRAALVADFPGVTRDRHYGEGRIGEEPFLVVDTGGFEPVTKSGLFFEMAKQTRQAIAEADIVIFIVDARDGLTPHDRVIADDLRRVPRPLVLAVNKSEGSPAAQVVAEFYELGLGDPVAISSAHGDNVYKLIEYALGLLHPASDLLEAPSLPETEKESAPKIAIVGRPNVGKSTLINTLLGENRVIAFDQPGTTRDSIYLDFEREGKRFTLIDTAGVRRKGRIDQAIEKFSVIKTMQAIEDANVVILVLDASQDISEQDAHLAAFILESGRALSVAINKWDTTDSEKKDWIKRELDRKLHFLDFADHHYISARTGFGVGELMRSVQRALIAANKKLSTPQLTRALQAAVERQQPARAGLIRPKLRYAHQGGTNPPVIVIHGNALNKVTNTYQRYLERFFCKTFELRGTPLQIQFKLSKNPYSQNQ